MCMDDAVFMGRGVSDRDVVTFGILQHYPHRQTDREGNQRGT
jgi:hypothetical protein